jgi:RNA polymerase sigma-70 factor (ECF subfamily)
LGYFNNESVAKTMNPKPTSVTDRTRAEFLQWYEPIHDRFLRYCDSRALGIHTAEDLAQEAVLAALSGWDRLEQKDRLLGYMIGIVNNQMRSLRRRAKFRAAWSEDRLAHLESRLGGNAELALDLHYLLNALEELPENQREALLLKAVSGFSIREIALAQHTSEGAVKTRISRARKQLRELLSEDGRRLTLGERLRIYAAILL